MLGLAGLIVGAIFGMVASGSFRRSELVSGTRENLRHRASEIAHSAKEKAERVMEKARRAAKEEAERQFPAAH